MFVLQKKLHTTVYPMIYVEDKEKGIRGSCATYHQRVNVTQEIRDDDDNVKMSLEEVNKRYV